MCCSFPRGWGFPSSAEPRRPTSSWEPPSRTRNDPVTCSPPGGWAWFGHSHDVPTGSSGHCESFCRKPEWVGGRRCARPCVARDRTRGGCDLRLRAWVVQLRGRRELQVPDASTRRSRHSGDLQLVQAHPRGDQPRRGGPSRRCEADGAQRHGRGVCGVRAPASSTSVPTSRRPVWNDPTLTIEGGAWPVLVAFATPAELPEMRGAAGRGGGTAFSNGNVTTYETGIAVLETDYFNGLHHRYRGLEQRTGDRDARARACSRARSRAGQRRGDEQGRPRRDRVRTR